MAIDYIHASFISRSCGHNALAAAAYRANEKLYCQQTGKTFDYENKTDCVYNSILLPESAYTDDISGDHPFSDRETLWNAVEKIENGHNRRATARLAMELKIALPKELSRSQQIELVESFIREKYIDPYGVAADVCVHDVGDGNPHAHVMLTFRQVIGRELSKKKVRDIAPAMRQSQQKAYCIKDGLNQDWRSFQNAYFQSHQLNIQVDQNHVIPTVHEGHHRAGPAHHEKRKTNQSIKAMNVDLVQTDYTTILKTLESRQSVFTDKDIQSLVFRMTGASTDRQAYQQLLDQVMASPSLVSLGYSASGRLSYTTRQTYERELGLADMAQTLDGARGHSINQRVVDQVSAAYTLNSEQAQALKTIVQSGQLVCVVGMAGTGKTHLMRAVNSVYEAEGVAVRGTALAGKVTHTLSSDAKISSDTIDRLLLLAEHGREKALPATGSVVVLDEAGMVGLDKFHSLVSLAKARQWKLICVGDPEQLQPIARGAPFRAMVERVGFCALSEVVRQRSAGDRQATRDLAAGQVGLVIDHYADTNAVCLGEAHVNHAALMQAYRETVVGQPQASVGIFAFRQSQVAALNQAARAVHQSMGQLTGGHRFQVKVSGQSVEREFAVGDRVMFLSNRTLASVEVKNGMVGTVTSIAATGAMQVQLAEGERVTFSLQDYATLDHAYAMTVHKAQGVTVDHALVMASGRGWDRHMAYVGLSRHRETLRLYADQATYGDLAGLKRALSEAPLRDNVLDYPLQFALRRGEDATTLIGNVVAKIRGFVDRAKDVWQQFFHATAWLRNQAHASHARAKQAHHHAASTVARLSDLSRAVNQSYQAFVTEHGQAWAKQPAAKAQFDQSLAPKFHERNALAHQLLPQMGQFEEALRLNHLSPSQVTDWATAHQCRERVRAFDQSEAVGVKGRLAMQLLANKSSHYRAMQEFQVDWQAVNLAQWRYRQQSTLKANGQHAAYETVGRYTRLRREMGKAWGRARAEHRSHHPNPNQSRNLQRAQAVTARLDALAWQIQSKPEAYGEALQFYKVDATALSRCAKRHEKVRETEHRQMAWEAFKALPHELVQDFVTADQKWRQAGEESAKAALYQTREEVLCRLLHSDASPTLENFNPYVMERLREQFYARHLTADQRQLLLHPEWVQFSKTASDYRGDFVNTVTRCRSSILSCSHNAQDVKELMEPFGRIFKKNMKLWEKEFKAAAPGLYATVKAVMPKLSRSYGRVHQRSRSVGLSQTDLASLEKSIIDSPDWSVLVSGQGGLKDFARVTKIAHELLIQHRGNAKEIQDIMKTLTTTFNRMMRTHREEFKQAAPHLYQLVSKNLPSMKRTYNFGQTRSTRLSREWKRD